MTYNTMNPVPSDDPRDLSDNSEAFDRFLQSTSASEPDRLGVQRKTWHQMEADAAALVSPNVSALAAAVSAANKLFYFTGSGAGAVTDLSVFARNLLDDADAATARGTLGAAPLASPSFTGTPVAPTASVGTSTPQLATTAFVIGQASSVSPLVNAASAAAGAATRFSREDHVHPTDTSRAPLASPAFTGTPTGPTAVVGTNTTQLATTAALQAEFANKRSWVSYTPIVTATTGSYTSASATGRYMAVFGICFFEATITITTKNTGVNPIITLPVAALTGADFMPIPAVETALNGKLGVCQILSGLTTASCKDYNNADLVTGNGSIIKVRGFYPIA